MGEGRRPDDKKVVCRADIGKDERQIAMQERSELGVSRVCTGELGFLSCEQTVRPYNRLHAHSKATGACRGVSAALSSHSQ